MRCNIIGYHANDKERVLKFISDDINIINSNDTLWLGDGMYFWDNKSNSEYWRKEKKKKESDKEFSILKSNLYIDQILDLTDLNTLKEMEALWDEFRKKSKHRKYYPLGQKINILFNYYEELPQAYKIIKVFGRYAYTPTINFFRMNRQSKICEPIYDVKAIYCVKDKSIISNKEYIEL